MRIIIYNKYTLKTIITIHGVGFISPNFESRTLIYNYKINERKDIVRKLKDDEDFYIICGNEKD